MVQRWGAHWKQEATIIVSVHSGTHYASTVDYCWLMLVVVGDSCCWLVAVRIIRSPDSPSRWIHCTVVKMLDQPTRIVHSCSTRARSQKPPILWPLFPPPRLSKLQIGQSTGPLPCPCAVVLAWYFNTGTPTLVCYQGRVCAPSKEKPAILLFSGQRSSFLVYRVSFVPLFCTQILCRYNS